MRSIFKRVYQKTNLDQSISFTILGRVVQSIGAVITLVLVTSVLDQNEQGYFYTFSSIISIQVFFELGLTSIIIQYVAHETAHLSWKNSQLVGEEHHKSRLASIVRLSIKSFLILSILLLIILLLAGSLFFSKYNSELSVNWQIPWVLLAVSTSLQLLVNLLLAILEGLGKVVEMTKLRLIQYSINLLLISIFLLGGLELLSAGLALLISSITLILFFFLSGYWKMINDIWRVQLTSTINYKKEVLPYHSKIALGPR